MLEAETSIRPILGLESERKSKGVAWSWLAILDFLVIAGLIAFVNADLIFAPGQSIELPRSSNSESRRIEAVLTVSGDLYLFDGRIFREDDIGEGFSAFFESNDKLVGVATLLIKMDSKSTLDSLLRVCEEAQASGFSAIHVAENPKENSAIDRFGD